MNFSKLNPINLLFISLVAGVSLCSMRAHGAAFDAIDIRPEGTLNRIGLKDMDGDGALDAVISSSRTEPSGARQRYLGIYAGGNNYQLLREQKVPDDAVAFGLGDFLGEKHAQLLYFTHDSVAAIPSATAAPKVLLSSQRFFFNKAVDHDLPYWDYIEDLNADHLDDLILADGSGYVVYLQNSNHEMVRSGRAEADFSFATQNDSSESDRTEKTGGKGGSQQGGSQRNRRGDAERSGPPPDIAKGGGWMDTAPPIVTSRRISRVCLADVNADHRVDLIAMKKDKLLAFFQSGEGRFPEKPDVSILLGPQGAKHAWDESRLPVAHGDINNDGHVDFVLSEIDPKELTTKLRVYLWGADGVPSVPNQILNLTGLGDIPQLVDLNADGFLDLGFLTLRADKILSVRKPEVEELDATYYAYLFDSKTGQFSRRPDVKHEYTSKVAGDVNEDQSREFAGFKGDYNGDGLRDLMVFENKGEMLIYFGGVKGASFDVESRPSIHQPIELPQRFYYADLNGDKKTDVILFYFDHVQILKSK